MIEAVDILTQLMGELGWIEIQVWQEPFSGFFGLTFEKKLQVTAEEFGFPKNRPLRVKKFTIQGREVRWQHCDSEYIVDLADPHSIDQIILYVNAPQE